MLEAGWAVGAVTGGILAGTLTRRAPMIVLTAVLALLSLGHAAMPFVTWLVVATLMQAVFGGCRAVGAILTQSAVMASVPKRLMGRTQSAFSVISTTMQVAMSFSLGWLAQHLNLPVAFLVLGLLYCGAVFAAVRARALTHTAPPPAV